ncbi:MAG: 2-hydroxychromene-2-carboxylate isomerase [Betaproteobacteria bacterium]
MTLDYYLTPVSPFTYFGHDRLRAICARHGAAIRLRIVDLGKVFPATGGLALKDRHPARQAYRLQELTRWRDFLGLPLNLHPKHFPVPALAASTTILAVLERHGTEAALDVAGDCLRAVWVEDRDVSAEGTLHDILSARGWDAAALLAHAASAQIAATLEAHTQEAIARGVFGSPFYVVGDQLFWGQDRLDFVDRLLAR